MLYVNRSGAFSTECSPNAPFITTMDTEVGHSGRLWKERRCPIHVPGLELGLEPVCGGLRMNSDPLRSNFVGLSTKISA